MASSVPPPVTITDKATGLADAPSGKTTDLLRKLLEENKNRFTIVLGNAAEYQVQIVYTQIDRKADNEPVFTHHYYQADPQRYFYPASVVKMPIAFLALQKLNELRAKGIAIDKNTAMVTGSARPAQIPVFNDPTTPDGKPTIAQYIRKIFLVSDNDAFNRLYEFLGSEYIQSNLQKMGYRSAEIIHRLSVPLSEEENRHTNPVSFYDNEGNLLYEQPAAHYTKAYMARNEKRGKGYYAGGKLVNAAFDFSRKNQLSLEDMHDMLRAVIFPQQTPAKKRFNLTEEDLRFLHLCMSQYPRESVSPQYDAAEFWDAYVKFNLAGAEKKPLPSGVRIFSKSGQAYGFLTDNTYIADFTNHIEFLLSATIYVNKDGIFNDDKYEYETIGLPFLKNLGEVIYQYELSRKRSHAPDLSEFRLTYVQ